MNEDLLEQSPGIGLIARNLVRGMRVAKADFIDPESGRLVEKGRSWWHSSAIPPQLRRFFARSTEEASAALRVTEVATAAATRTEQEPAPARTTETPLYGTPEYGGQQYGGQPQRAEPEPPPPRLHQMHAAVYRELIEQDDPRHPQYKSRRWDAGSSGADA